MPTGRTMGILLERQIWEERLPDGEREAIRERGQREARRRRGLPEGEP